MSVAIAILLDSARIRALVSSNGATVVEVGWDPASPEDGARRLRDALGAAPSIASVVLVVGLGFLEIAQPELPPLAPEARRTMLLRDADRYFPLEGEVAIAWENGFAFALPEPTLRTMVRAFEALGRIEAVLALPYAIARAASNGTFFTDAASGERGTITVRESELRDVRRVPATSNDAPLAPARDLDVPGVLRAALGSGSAAVTAQLLDTVMAASFERRRRGRWWRSTALIAAALVASAWVADALRNRQLTEAQQQVAKLAADAAPAQRAALRLERALAERALLASADSLNGSGTTPAAILARLGALLPKDAFVQRLEWDGTAWRIDGSASEAPRIVPLLDADPHFSDVRIVAASTRFLDAGKQRESFSIAFRTKPVTTGARSGQ